MAFEKKDKKKKQCNSTFIDGVCVRRASRGSIVGSEGALTVTLLLFDCPSSRATKLFTAALTDSRCELK